MSDNDSIDALEVCEASSILLALPGDDFCSRRDSALNVPKIWAISK